MNFLVIFLILILISACSKKEKSVTAVETNATVRAKRGTIEHVVTWRGTVRSSQRIEIRAERKVKVSKNRVRNFEPVKKGQLLLEVDNTETQTKVRELKDKAKTMELEFQSVNIKYKHAQKVLERKKALFDKGIIAQKEHDEASRDFRLTGSEIRAKELEMEKLGRDLAEASDQMKSSNFVAPMDGVVTGLVIPDSNGTDVQAGQTIATLSDPERLALWVGVEEPYLHKVKQDMEAQVSLDSIANAHFPGKIISIGTSEMPGGTGHMRTYEVGVSFTVKDRPIREGYTGKAKVSFVKKEQTITLPLAALKFLDGKDFVAIASGISGSATAKAVTTGLRSDTEVEILSGVNENDTVYLETPEK